MANGNLREIMESHGHRLDGLKDDVDALKSGQRSMMDRLISMEKRSQERKRNRIWKTGGEKLSTTVLSSKNLIILSAS